MLKSNKSNTFSIIFICHLLHSETKPLLLDNYKYKKLCVKQLALSDDNIIQKVLVSQEKRLSYSFSHQCFFVIIFTFLSRYPIQDVQDIQMTKNSKNYQTASFIYQISTSCILRLSSTIARLWLLLFRTKLRCLPTRHKPHSALWDSLPQG